MATQAMDYPIARVDLVADGITNPIRNQASAHLPVQLAVHLAGAARDYCGADLELSKDAITECVKILESRFPSIGIVEIRQAFEMATIGELDANATAYAGKFTVDLFGRVMRDYMNWRKGVQEALVNARIKEEMEKTEEQNKEKNKATAMAVQSQFLALCKFNDRYERAADIPHHWISILQKAGHLEKSPEDWLAAKWRVCEDFVNRTSAGGVDITVGNQAKCLEIRKAILEDADFFPTELYQRACNLYGRMLIFNKLAPYSSDQPLTLTA